LLLSKKFHIFKAKINNVMQVNKIFIFKLVFLSLLIKSTYILSQNYITNEEEYSFVKKLDATPVKDQYNSNTCWSFAVISLLESELLRQGKGIYDLSELYVVRKAYAEKAVKYVRMHGQINFTDAGEANDVTDIIKKYGIVPEEIYPFSIINEKNYNLEMDFKLKEYISNVIDTDKKLDPSWYKGFKNILYSYIGDVTDTFTFNEKEYTPQSYAESLELETDDYILLTSFTHHPFYTRFIMELPDNWSWGQAYNVPLDELIEIIDSAIYKDYTVVWAADISEEGFDFRKGLAVISEEEEVITVDTITDISDYQLPEIKDENLSSIELKDKTEKITQEIRQEAFNDYTTTDDHSMHIIGISKSRDNTKYYYVKNSWGIKSFYQGYLFASEDYVRYKTVLLMLNRKALPVKIATKLNIKY
jgi:bleomycin hydrolase